MPNLIRCWFQICFQVFLFSEAFQEERQESLTLTVLLKLLIVYRFCFLWEVGGIIHPGVLRDYLWLCSALGAKRCTNVGTRQDLGQGKHLTPVLCLLPISA